MQFISGFLRTAPAFRRKGSAQIVFDKIPQHGENVRTEDVELAFNAHMRQPILVNENFEGTGRIVDSADMGRAFKGFPAYAVHIRKWVHEDRTSFAPSGGEMDEYMIDAHVTKDHLIIRWDLGDEGELVEIGFICVGT